MNVAIRHEIHVLSKTLPPSFNSSWSYNTSHDTSSEVCRLGRADCILARAVRSNPLLLRLHNAHSRCYHTSHISQIAR